MNTLTFNGHASNEFGIRIEKKPTLSRPARKFRAASVPGRNGNIYELEDAFEEIIQPYEIFAGSSLAGSAVSSFTDIMEWLHSADGYAVLSDTYDTTHYRMAVFVDSTDIESMWHTWGRAVINFRCRPERFLTGQTSTVLNGGTINNNTNHIAKPEITLTGSGVKSLFNLEGRTMVSAGTIVNKTSLGSYVSYRDTRMWMVKANGSNAITVSGNTYGTIDTIDNANGELFYNLTASSQSADWGVGIILAVDPNTDYTLSWEANNSGVVGSKTQIWFADKSGSNAILGTVFQETSVGSWVADQLTFHTPSGCGYILVSFGHLGGSGISVQKFRKIMLNYGKTKKTFQGYSAPVLTEFAIGDTTLKFSSIGYTTAVIDCDKENVTMDGVDSNQTVTLVDPYGNISEEYLQLVKGNNIVTFSGDITACSIDPRTWNL